MRFKNTWHKKKFQKMSRATAAAAEISKHFDVFDFLSMFAGVVQQFWARVSREKEGPQHMNAGVPWRIPREVHHQYRVKKWRMMGLALVFRRPNPRGRTLADERTRATEGQRSHSNSPASPDTPMSLATRTLCCWKRLSILKKKGAAG